MSRTDDHKKGLCSKVFVFRCIETNCSSKYSIEGAGYIAILQSDAIIGAREEGWSHKKAGWTCPLHQEGQRA